MWCDKTALGPPVRGKPERGQGQAFMRVCVLLCEMTKMAGKMAAVLKIGLNLNKIWAVAVQIDDGN